MERRKRNYSYRNWSIQAKMMGALLGCILIPFSIIGGSISNRMFRQEMANQRSYERSLLREVVKEIDDITGQAELFLGECRENNSIYRILSGKATEKDYLSLSKTFTEGVDQNETWFAVGIGNSKRILFQRGKKYLDESVDETYINRLHEEASFWTGIEQMEYWEYGEKQKENVIVLYSNLYNMFQYSQIGECFISISEEKIRQKYTRYLLTGSMSTLLIDDVGEIISTDKEEDLGEICPYLEKIKLEKDSQSGYIAIKYEGVAATLYYVRCANGWYLINIMEEKGVNSGIIFMILVIAICILFGLTYAWLQNRYIIRPLRRLSSYMDRIKGGELEEIQIQANDDEIGTIIRNFEQMMKQINHLINQVYLERIKTQDAEREVLMTQMKPHFLYNTLDSIHWTAVRNKDMEVGKQLEALAEIFKHILNFGRKTLTLGEELELVNDYFYLVKVRNSVTMELEILMEESLRDQAIPKLMIQPLVENSVNYGIGEREKGGRIRIKIKKVHREDKSLLVITVADNGVGTDQERIRGYLHETKEISEAFALRNINERAKINSGCSQGLQFYSRKGRGTVVKIYLKCEEKRECV